MGSMSCVDAVPVTVEVGVKEATGNRYENGEPGGRRTHVKVGQAVAAGVALRLRTASSSTSASGSGIRARVLRVVQLSPSVSDVAALRHLQRHSKPCGRIGRGQGCC